MAVAQYTIEYTPQIHDVFRDITNLKLEQATEGIVQYKSDSPNNLAAYHMESYIDFYSLFINENEELYDALIANKYRYLSRLKEGPKDSPYYRFTQAEVLLQWALIDLKFDHKIKAGKAIYDAYRLLEKNKKAFPDFMDNNKSLSIIHVLAESLPSWVRSILGIKGSIQLGEEEIAVIKDYALKNEDYIFRSEVAAINSYILFYQSNRKEEAIQDLKSFNLDHRASPIVAFLKASMSLRSGDNEACLQYLEDAPNGPAYAEFHYLNFMKGRSMLYKLDPNADVYLLKYVQSFKGQHFIKEAYQKLAWHALVIRKDQALYDHYNQLCISQGSELLDEDRQALKEAKVDYNPNPLLLKARILYDGGYLHQAYQLLNKEPLSESFRSPDQVQYHYRLGRIIQGLGNPTDALLHFAKAVDLGDEDKSYYPCASLLQMGNIYEKQNALKLAKQYYNWCMNTPSPEYETTLHQKAKSGLERVIAIKQ